MFTPKANSKQKRTKNVNVFQKIGGRIATLGAQFLSNQNWKNSSEIGGRFWQFGSRFWASKQFKNQFNNALFT